MKLFSLNISLKDRAAGGFKGRVNRALVKAVITAKREKTSPSPKLQIKWESISLHFPNYKWTGKSHPEDNRRHFLGFGAASGHHVLKNSA